MGYTRDAIKGFSWLGSFRVVTRVVSFARTAIVARVLTPSLFGIYGIATLVLSLVEILTETGINIFLGQQREDIHKYINTAWIVSIFRGVLMFLIIFFSSGWISSFFNAPSAQEVLMLASFIPLIRGFINPSVVIFTKELHYKKEFYYRTSVFLVESITAVLLVLVFHSPTALVWGLVLGALFEVMLTHIIASPRPRLEFRTELFKQIMSSGKWITAAGIFNYLYHNIDNIVVGRMLGPASLGVYDMTYRISMLPMTEAADVIGKVTFPVYVKISDDKKRLRRAYFRSLSGIVLLAAPITCICLFFPEFVIRVLLGPQWLSAVSLLQVLIVFGAVRSITFSAVTVFYAARKQQYSTVVTFVSVMGMVVTVIPFIYWYGVIGAGYSALIGALLATPIIGYYLYKVLY